MSLLKEFKSFAMRGNVTDMAVGIIIGAAFGKIVTSLVNDVIMPPLGLLIGKVNFSDLFVALNGESYASIAAAREAGAPVLAYGNFIQTTFDFIIVAFAIFMIIKGMNKMKKAEEAAPAPAPAPPAPSKEELLLAEIRDILKNK
ncbi:large conductance mechanosensitive channel [Breznakibacter xylanolyticus]|uniref:Large-conductance mechanosensitive channel n=1 Tax=Breznakibacter xylanolyticus TaxID=990 RepID=A0A2W7NIA6_9BACT|nr:large-conductance mechanosensitive channel protein MscL [Breznakibacter xylanolyticus]PZX16414.1 large conductance mechanosensitive channel [Breznakibacter xylanolyticus]